MKIAFAVEHFDGTKGGAERYVWRFASWLVGEGHSLDVFTEGRYAEMDGVCVRVLDAGGVQGMSRQIRFGYALQAALKDASYDVVQGFNHVWPADVLMLHGGVHLAYEQYNAMSAASGAGRFVKRLAYRWQRKYRALRLNEQLQFGDAQRRFVAVSKRVANDMRRYYPKVSGRIDVIYPGIDVSHFREPDMAVQRKAVRERMGVSEECPVFLFVSHNYRLKGLHDLIRAMPLVLQREPDSELWVVGRGRSGAFERLAQRCGVSDRVRFMGQADDIREMYAGADVLVHPSYYDTFGGVCMEAMASGLRVVMSRNCGASELMEKQPGVFTFEMPAETDVIAQEMIEAVALDWSDADRDAARSFAGGFPVENNFKRVMELYRGLGT